MAADGWVPLPLPNAIGSTTALLAACLLPVGDAALHG